MSDSAEGLGWHQAGDGKWYPPQPGPGSLLCVGPDWWLAEDGRWYPAKTPETPRKLVPSFNEREHQWVQANRGAFRANLDLIESLLEFGPAADGNEAAGPERMINSDLFDRRPEVRREANSEPPNDLDWGGAKYQREVGYVLGQAHGQGMYFWYQGVETLRLSAASQRAVREGHLTSNEPYFMSVADRESGLLAESAKRVMGPLRWAKFQRRMLEGCRELLQQSLLLE
jgi:hypothetical protein